MKMTHDIAENKKCWSDFKDVGGDSFHTMWIQ